MNIGGFNNGQNIFSKKKSAAKIGGCAHALPLFSMSRSSPTGFVKNLHPTGSIFYKNLDTPPLPPFQELSLFFFSFFLFSLSLKMSTKTGGNLL
jgi:hypothetical protein